MLNTRDEMEHLRRNKTHEVRLRFWRASGLLSTSGGILFATVSGECTRNAKSVVTVGGLARLLVTGSDATGSGDEGDISNNNRDDGRAKSECVKSQLALDSREVIENVLVAGNARRVDRCALRRLGMQDIALHFPWLRTWSVRTPFQPHVPATPPLIQLACQRTSRRLI